MVNTPSLRQTYADDLRLFYPETDKEKVLIEAIQRIADSITYNRPIVTFSKDAEPGQLVHLYNDGMVLTAELAEAGTPKYAFGFVSATSPVPAGMTGEVTLLGNNLYLSGLIPGAAYYLSNTPGAVSISAGTNEQFVGVALTDGTLFMNFGTGFAGRFGNVTGPALADDNGLVLFDGTSGGQIKQASGTGYLYSILGIASFLSQDDVRTDLAGNGLTSGLARRAPTQRIVTSDYTLVAADSDVHILHPSSDTSARIITIPDNVAVAFPIGTRARIINQNVAGALTIAITTDTLQWLGSGGLTGTRTLATDAYADIEKISNTVWIITGIGLT